MLFGWILESSLLILMILGLRKLFMGRVPYAGIYALWLMVLFRFLIPINLISTPFSVNHLISAYQSSAEKIKASKLEQAGASQGEDVSQRALSESTLDSAIQKALSEKQLSNNQGKEKFSIYKAKGARESRLKNFIKSSGVDWWMLFQRIWVMISSVLLLWFISSNLSMIRKLKQKRVWYGKRGRIEIYAVSGIKNPCLYGLFRPVIYLPEVLLEADSALCVDTEELEQIITHEYVHYLHKDHIWSVLRILLVSVYWFDPLLWMAVSCSKKDAELFCDETALRLLGEEKRFEYGELLLKLAEKNSWGDFRYSMLSMSKQGKEMEKRIRAISVCRHYSKGIFFSLLLLAALVTGTTCSTGIGPASGWKVFSASGSKAGQSVSEKDGTQNKTMQTIGESKNPLPVSSVIPGILAGGDTQSQPSFAGMPSDYQEWLHNIQNTAPVLSDKNMPGEKTTIAARTYQEAFEHYINAFTEAVNTGNTDKLQQVLAVDSEVYKQQCAIAKNYYERGIREKVKSYSISQVDTISQADTMTTEQIEISSQEKIKVFYADTTSKLVRQKYRYTCECIDGNWVITKMEEI